MKPISIEQAKDYIPLNEDYLDNSIENAEYFTITPDKDGWDKVRYYSGRKRNMYSDKNDGDEWVY